MDIVKKSGIDLNLILCDNMKHMLDVIALGCAMIGSFLIASNIGMIQLGYVFFLASSLASVVLLRRSDASKSLLMTNIFFVGVNVFGLFRYW